MMPRSDAPTRFPWPPVVTLAAIVLGAVLQWAWPLPFVPAPLSDILFAMGLLVIVLALGLAIQAVRTLGKERTTVMPNRGSTALVTSGPFALSRNPIYVGDVGVILGLALALGNAWLLPAAVLAGFAIRRLAIDPEERALEAHFGKRFRDYAKRVRRWL